MNTAATRALVLVDGEHYPPVLVGALEALRAQGVEPVAALVLGGSEKVAAYGAELGLGVPTRWVPKPPPGTGFDVSAAGCLLAELARDSRADEVRDLSDDPPLDARNRLHLAAHALAAGLPYHAPDCSLRPPPRPLRTAAPTIAVIGTGKRAGKTAIASAVARRLRERGSEPVIVAMGRGGPEEPVVVPAGQDLGVETLLAVADAGGHAASDFYEDALTSGAATVGARRAGGGLAGAVGHSNLDAALAAAGGVPHDVVLLEGSGAAVPPAHADVTVLVVPGDADLELVTGYLGPYRILLADLVVVTMAALPDTSPQRVQALIRGIRSISSGTVVLRTVFHPEPLQAVSGARVFLATTAPQAVGTTLVDSLQTRFGCEVVGISHRLADRPGLREDLEAAPPYEVLLVELKAAAVDVAVRIAAEVGARVVFCDNRPTVLGVDDPRRPVVTPGTAFERAVDDVAELAVRRHAARGEAPAPSV